MFKGKLSDFWLIYMISDHWIDKTPLKQNYFKVIMVYNPKQLLG